MTCFSKIKACMGVIYFLICVRKHESNLPTNINIRTTVGEENTMIYRKMRPFEWNHILALFYDSVVCFLLPKCVFFYQWCFIMFFITTLCFYDFCKTVLVKKYTPCKVWFDFPLPNAISSHWLLCGTLTTQLKPIKSQNNVKKWLKGAALELPPGLMRPGPCEPEFWKNDLRDNFFCCMYFSKV